MIDDLEKCPCRRWDKSGQAPYLIDMPKIIDDKNKPNHNLKVNCKCF